MLKYCKLGINIDHIATVRNARGGIHPNLLRAAKIVKNSKADSITMHLREDRRHVVDKDLFEIKNNVDIPINLEIAPTEEMIDITLSLQPHSVCFVPERRQELTTEGGLNILSCIEILKKYIKLFNSKQINVACFIEPDLEQIKELKKLGIKCIEFHTGKYASKFVKDEIEFQFQELKKAIEFADKIGFNCHAGHGLNFENVSKIASIRQIKELNIGHFIIGESIFSGLQYSIDKMREIIDIARS